MSGGSPLSARAASASRGASARPLRVAPAMNRGARGQEKNQKGRWRGLDEDISDDQMDIQRGRDMVDSKFQGGFGQDGTHNAILQSNDYDSGKRTLSSVDAEGYYICPAFLDKLTVHIVKNFLDLPKIKIPLILGIWGGKGQGKSFQCELAYKRMGIDPIMMSAGELESGNAGEPAKLVRQRYREAADIITKGKMCSLYINDLDAGAGRMGGTTQYTVNNQMVNATLMNIADNPTNVQLPGVYQNDAIPRVPVVVTGNDFSTLYAPLVRDGRMEKFYWAPTREDRIGVATGIFKPDGISDQDVTVLVDTFPTQSIDFFGALRARVYDDKVRDFIGSTGLEALSARLVNSREGKVTFEQPNMSLDILMKYGQLLTQEQDNVTRVQLANEYLDSAALPGSESFGGQTPQSAAVGGAPPAAAPPAYSPPPAAAPPAYSPPPAAAAPAPSTSDYSW